MATQLHLLPPVVCLEDEPGTMTGIEVLSGSMGNSVDNQRTSHRLASRKRRHFGACIGSPLPTCPCHRLGTALIESCCTPDADVDEQSAEESDDEEYQPEPERRASRLARLATGNTLASMPALPERQEPNGSSEASPDIGPASLKKRGARIAASSSFRWRCMQPCLRMRMHLGVRLLILPTRLCRGVTRHSTTGRYEAHLWDSSYNRPKTVRY